jgi:hypothetical protein
MAMCDCDDDELAFVDATGDDRVTKIGSNGATGDAGDVDPISGEGFLLRFFDVGTEVGTGARVGTGWGEAVAEMGESASTEENDCGLAPRRRGKGRADPTSPRLSAISRTGFARFHECCPTWL